MAKIFVTQNKEKDFWYAAVYNCPGGLPGMGVTKEEALGEAVLKNAQALNLEIEIGEQE